MELAEIRTRKEELQLRLKELEVQQIQSLNAKKEELSKQILSLENEIKTLDPSSRKRGKGFGEININDLILQNVNPQGSKVREIINKISLAYNYDGKKQSIISSVSSSISKLVKSGKLVRKDKGIYATK